MKLLKGYNHTIRACFVAFIIQAALINFAPLLFLTFQDTYHLSFADISIIISANFITQIVVDIISIKTLDIIGARRSMVLAHIFVSVGFVGLAVFPEVFPSPFVGILIATMCYAVGGGIFEVMGSPIVESCPSDHKAGAMSLLHSFYCWGQVFVVLTSTIFFLVVGIENWRVLSVIWAILPIVNGIYFCFVPIAPVDHDSKLSFRSLLKNRLFWVLLLIMVCAGASEQAMSQWASAFAEEGLGTSKLIADIAGPCLFAIFMGISRTFYGKMSKKINLTSFMVGSGILCLVSYLVVSLSVVPFISFIASAFCGLSVGIMWPGTISIGAKRIPTGGTAMFAMFAFAGDIGCSLGPGVVGAVFENTDRLQTGFFAVIIFPILLVLGVLFARYYHVKAKATQNKA